MRALCLLLSLLAALLTSAARAQVVPLPALQANAVSVSGLSSGGYMAVQFEVAFSRTVVGAGIVAGGPYYCSQGNVLIATTTCSCTNDYLACGVRSGGTDVPYLIAATDWFASNGAIDPTSSLASHRVWMLSGSADTVVPQPVMNDLATYYRHYIPSANISYVDSLNAQHAMPTDSYGNSCTTLGSPYINNCSYDAAGELLKWIYGTLNPRGDPTGRVIAFDQSEFIGVPTWHGMADVGYLYIPPACESGGGCKLHVVFHGCLQDPGDIGLTFIQHAGYNAWADSNNLLILYPQASPTYDNPRACWDWFAYDDTRYAQKNGRQMAAVKRMVDRLTGP